MDLVERAVELLAKASESRLRAAPAHDAVHQTPDRIERAFALEEAHAAAGPAQARRGRPAPDATRATSRAVQVDLKHLRQQRIITPDEERSLMTESFRRVKRHILAGITHPNAPAGRNLVMVTSALPGEGKTFCAVNLAVSIAMETHRTVLLVDADPAEPGVAAALGLDLDTPRGFVDVLRDPLIPLSEVLCRTNIGKLTVLPAGTPDLRATELFAGEGAGALLRELAARYDDRVVIFDTAPLLAASEASALAAHMGQIVVVVEAYRTTEKTLKEALERIESCNVAGLVLNRGAKPSATQGGDGYGYGYGNAT